MTLRRKSSVGIYTIADLEAKCIPQDDGCMLWAGGKTKHRGAVMWLPKLKQSVSATQAFEVLKSTKLEAGKRWRPTCGNTLCCANAHRVQMTASEWMRLIRPTLSPVHRARITKSQRARSPYYSFEAKAEIMASDETDAQLSDRLGIPVRTINKVRSGQAWAFAHELGASVFNSWPWAS